MHRYLKNRKLLLGVALVVALLAVALWPTAAAVEVGVVRRGPLEVSVEHEGKTRIHERFAVTAPVAGRVLRIELEPGDAVKKDLTLLATFEPGDPGLLDARSRAEAEARVSAARAGLGSARAAAQGARASFDLARDEAERQRALARQQIASKAALDTAETAARAAEETLRAAEFAARSAEHELEVAKAQLVQSRGAKPAAALEIRSPIDGVVLTRLQQSEAVLPAGAPLLELGAPHDLEVVADFLSTDAVKIRPGDKAFVEQWGGEKPLHCRVRRVEPSGFLKVSALGVEEQRVNVVVDFEDPVEAWRRLGDGYRVEVRVVIWEQPDVLQLPTGALFRHGESWAAYVVEGGRARLHDLEVGRRNGLAAQVLGGLEAGARVVLHPGDAVDDGTRVAVRSAG